MTKKFTKDFTKDYYKGLSGVYFFKILNTIIKMGNLRDRNVKILDFGCGVGHLKKLLPGKVINYDLNPELTEIDDWKNATFDAVVANQVLIYLSKDELMKLLDELYKHNPKLEMYVGISTQGIINKILRIFANQRDSYADVKLSPKDEISALKQKMDVIKKKNVFFMCDVYSLRFKKPN